MSAHTYATLEIAHQHHLEVARQLGAARPRSTRTVPPRGRTALRPFARIVGLLAGLISTDTHPRHRRGVDARARGTRTDAWLGVAVESGNRSGPNPIPASGHDT